MNQDQTSPAIKMEVDDNSLNNSASPRKNLESREEYNQETNFPNFPNQILESLTTIKKFLSQQVSENEIKITKNEVMVNGKTFEVNYEACSSCKSELAQLTCSQCQRKICSKCVATRNSDNSQCFRCKNAKKAKNKINSEFDTIIENLLELENSDKIREAILTEVENLAGKSFEHLIELAKKLKKKGDKLDREISITYFYVGKVFYEKMEVFFSENNLSREQKTRKILGSFRHAKDLDFGKERLTIKEIKEKLSIDDRKISRFFGLTLKVFLTYQGFESSEEQIRKATKVPAIGWLRDLSQEKFLDFSIKLEQRKRIKEEY